MNLWFTFLYQPLVNFLILFYQVLGHNLGLAIIFSTIVIRVVLIPLTTPSLKAAQKMKDLAPELEKLKKQFSKDKQALTQRQLELYKKHGINPAAGCLPQILQIIILIALFQAFSQVLAKDGDIINKLNSILYPALQLLKTEIINMRFLYLDLTKPDMVQLPFQFKVLGFVIDKIPGIFLIASAATQYITSKMMMPAAKLAVIKAEKTPQQEDDMAATMQKQMLYMMPLMTLFIGFNFPSGLVLYWLTFSVFMLAQQLVVKYKEQNGKKQQN